MGQSVAAACCHVERLPRQQLSVASAPVAGPRPGVQVPDVYGKTYEELLEGSELDATTWVHNDGVRSMEIRNMETGLLYSAVRIRKMIAPENDHAIEEHLKALCGVCHPHLCKVVECFDMLEDRVLVCELPPERRLFETAMGRPWTENEKEGSTTSSQDANQMKKDERTISEMLRQLLSGLAHGEAKGLMHGSITPDKIRLGKGFRKSQAAYGPPQVKLIGFGLAHVLIPCPGNALFKELKFGADLRAFQMLPGLPYTGPETFQSAEDYISSMRVLIAEYAGSASSASEIVTSRSGSPRSQDGSDTATEKTEGDDATERSSPRQTTKVDLDANLLLLGDEQRGVWHKDADQAVQAQMMKADIWSLGALAFRLLTGVPPFAAEVKQRSKEGHHKQDLIAMIRQEPVAFIKKSWEGRSSKAFDVCRQMLRLHPGLRPTAAELLRHPWLHLEKEKVPVPRVQRLLNNSLNNLKESQFKKLVIRIVAEQMPEGAVHMQQANAVFRALDKDRDGLLSPAEFVQGLSKLPDIVERVGEDVARLFEAADRDGSGFLDSKEFAAMCMPPSKSRDEKVIWYVFRAFDEEFDHVVTIDKILHIAKLLEGRLVAASMVEDLMNVLNSELNRLRVPPRVEPEQDEANPGSSDEDHDIRADGEEDEVGMEASKSSKDLRSSITGGKDMTASMKDVRRSSISAGSKEESETGSKGEGGLDDTINKSMRGSQRSSIRGSTSLGSKEIRSSVGPGGAESGHFGASQADSAVAQKKKKGKGPKPPWLQRRLQGLIEKSRKWVTKPRPLDFGEFAYLCDTRRKGMGPVNTLKKAVRKEAFRFVQKWEWDFYEVVHKVSTLTWPEEVGMPAKTAPSVYFAPGGLCSSKQQKLRADKSKDPKDQKKARIKEALEEEEEDSEPEPLEEEQEDDD